MKKQNKDYKGGPAEEGSVLTTPAAQKANTFSRTPWYSRQHVCGTLAISMDSKES